MPRMIFVNLPVADVAKATAFYERLGAMRETRFSNESSSMMSFSYTIHFMLLSHARFAEFTTKTIPDARTTAQVLLCPSEESREGVDTFVQRGIDAGGRADPTPKQDFGFMYGRSFEDLDGHVIEVTWMDMAAVAKAGSTPSPAP